MALWDIVILRKKVCFFPKVWGGRRARFLLKISLWLGFYGRIPNRREKLSLVHISYTDIIDDEIDAAANSHVDLFEDIPSWVPAKERKRKLPRKFDINYSTDSDEEDDDDDLDS